MFCLALFLRNQKLFLSLFPYVMNIPCPPLPPGAFKIVFSLVFRKLIVMFFNVFFLIFYFYHSWCSLSFLDLWVYIFEILKVIRPLFKCHIVTIIQISWASVFLTFPSCSWISHVAWNCPIDYWDFVKISRPFSFVYFSLDSYIIKFIDLFSPCLCY